MFDKKAYNKKYLKMYGPKWYENNKERHIKNVSKNNKKRRKELKLYVIKELGGKCSASGCDYDKNSAAFEIHHIDPNEKDIMISTLINKKGSLKGLKKELETKKLLLMCSNCHRELHNPDCNL